MPSNLNYSIDKSINVMDDPLSESLEYDLHADSVNVNNISAMYSNRQ